MSLKIDIEDRLDLLDLPKIGADAVCRKDPDQYASMYTEDAIWDPRPILPDVYQGKATIRHEFVEALATVAWVAQTIYMTVIVDCDGETALLRSYIGEWGKLG
ncbi:MAG: nuclear transport factor 2 family protein, partial [Actinobacteria bacterium]|nr:nuclear transport factor 2 family protein [Actinomycetota bacterium]